MNADMLLQTLGQELVDVVRPYWCGHDYDSLHAAMASFLLTVLKANNTSQRMAVNGRSLAEVEKQHILTVLAECGGHQVNAARALGMDRTALYRRLKKYGLKSTGRCRTIDVIRKNNALARS